MQNGLGGAKQHASIAPPHMLPGPIPVPPRSSQHSGSVIMHVYQDWGMIPSIEQVTILASGEVGESKFIKRGDINREIQATLVMAPEVAISIGKWLISKGAAGYKARQDQEPPIEFEEDPSDDQ